MLPQYGHRRQSLERRHVARAGHDKIRAAALIVAGPLPDPDAFAAVLDRPVHRQPLWRRMFARHHYIDVVTAAQAMIHHRQQAIGIGRQVDPHDLRLLVDYMVEETGVLMRETIVILSPDMRTQQVIERRDLAAPWEACRYPQPFGMLIEHRIDDVNERLVAIEQPVPSREQVAFEPTLALVLAQHL